MIKRHLFAVAVILVLVFISGVHAEVFWLDTLDMNRVEAGWGQSRANQSVEGNPLSIGGKAYERGIGTHAESLLLIQLDGKAERLTAFVGIDDEVTHEDVKGEVEFKIVGDDRELWSSGLMRGRETAKEVNIALSGIHTLKLCILEGEENTYDHADWAMAKIEYSGQAPALKEAPRPVPYILTPKAGPQPRITGPKVFGVRPGNPVLFTVTATGQRPMKFEIKNIPDGLTLDPVSGRITGVVKTGGEYYTTVIASNVYGQVSRPFRIVAGDTICLTPPMGWNSWNSWACAVDDEKVRASARAMVDSGLIDHGWSYINIDDCWMRQEDNKDPALGGPVRDKDGYPIPNAKFPDMKGLTDYIHGLGLKAGIYISPGPTTCQGYVGSWKYELQDAQQFAEWGFDYLKYDWCGYSDVSKGETLDELKGPYVLMRKMLDQFDRDIVYSLCQYGWGEVWKWGEEVGGNCWRTTGDITDTWASLSKIGFSQASCSPYANPGHWNDPDMLIVGKVGWGPKLHDTRLTADEQYTHISLWCLLSAPLLIGCPIEQIDEFTMSLLTNDEVLDINQDALGLQARQIYNESGRQVWVKPLEDGSVAVGLFNTDNINAQRVKIMWKDINKQGRRKVRDLWRQTDEGWFAESFSEEIPVHGVKLIRVE